MSPAAVGVSFDGATGLASVLARARAAEAAGASTLWVASHVFLREPISVAALILSATSRIRVALMAVSPYLVHPVHAAMAAATLDESFPGRVVLCLGTGAPGGLKSAGLEATRPVQTLREALDVVRGLLAGALVKHDGEVFRVHGRTAVGGAHPVPVYLAASGPRMLALAGESADGVVLSAAASLPFVEWAVAQVDRAAKGRPVRRVGLVYASVSAGGNRPLDRFRRTLAATLGTPHHRPNVEMGSRLGHEALARAVAAEDWMVADALVSDEVVRHHSVSGSPAEVGDGVRAYHRAGLDEVVIAGTRDEAETTRTIAAALRPRA